MKFFPFFQRNIQYPKGPPFQFFSQCETFFENFSMSPKGPPFNAFHILQQTGFS